MVPPDVEWRFKRTFLRANPAAQRSAAMQSPTAAVAGTARDFSTNASARVCREGGWPGTPKT
jgi:hypothetical protein